MIKSKTLNPLKSFKFNPRFEFEDACTHFQQNRNLEMETITNVVGKRKQQSWSRKTEGQVEGNCTKHVSMG